MLELHWIQILDDPDDLKVSPELVKEIKELNIPIDETAIVKEIKGNLSLVHLETHGNLRKKQLWNTRKTKSLIGQSIQ